MGVVTTVRAATPADVADWRALRRDGIARFPSAFIPSLEEHDATPEADDAARLSAGDRFLAFQRDNAIGLIGMNRYPGRAAHRGEIGPFYVVPAAQGSGAAAALMDAVLVYAAEVGIWQPELTVNKDNLRARALYTRFGFEQIGNIPNAIMGADGPEHDLLMARLK